jgi:hypothetical protein
LNPSIVGAITYGRGAGGPGGKIVRIKLNRGAYANARRLIEERRAALDDRDAWSEHRPSAPAENAFIDERGWDEYGKWFLGIDEEADEETKGRYKFPYGDFERVHRCGVLSAESRAGQYKHLEVERAAAHLHGMLDALLAEGVSEHP